MKHVPFAFALALLTFVAGCATQRQVASMEGQGDRRTYDAPFDQVWRAAVDASQRSDLEVLSADRASGYIAVRRTIQPHTFGENVGVWVRSVSPAQTEVEVVSRQAGPPVFWLKNWQNEIHRSIAANLTREAPAVGSAPGATVIERGGTTVIVPRSQGEAQVPPATVPQAWVDQQRRVNALQAEREARQRDAAAEPDSLRRDAIDREIDRLNHDIGIEEQRLRDMEQGR